MKKNTFITGRIRDFARGKGWFFGHFMREKLLQSDLVDVSWQHFARSPATDVAHYHKRTVEINIVMKGSITCEINHTKVTAVAGNFYVLWPNAVMTNFRTAPDTDVIVIRAPSIPNGGKVKITKP